MLSNGGIRIMRKIMNNKKGFTLIELIVVIAIIAILAAVAIPKLSGFQASARDSRDKANIKLLNNLSQVYNADKGSYVNTTNDNNFGEFIDAMVTANYLTSDDATELKTAASWKSGAIPTYTEATGLVK